MHSLAQRAVPRPEGLDRRQLLSRLATCLGATALGSLLGACQTVAQPSSPAAAPAPTAARVAEGQPATTTAAATVTVTKTATLVFAHAQIGPSEEIPFFAVPRKLGYFQAEGLEVQAEYGNGSSAAFQLLAGGSAQFAQGGADIMMATREKGVGARAIMNVDRIWPYAIAVTDDSPIKDPKELKGKTIGVPSLGSAALPYAKALAKEQGLDPEKDIKFVAAGLGAQAAVALTNKQVDAMSLWDSAFAVLEQSGIKLRYLHGSFEKNLIGLVQATTEDAIAKDPALIVGLNRALIKGYTFTKANPEAAVRIFYSVYPNAAPSSDFDAKLQSDLKPLVAELNSFEDATRPFGEFDLQEWIGMQDYAVSAGVITTKVSDPNVFFSGEFVKKAKDFDVKAIQEQARAYKA